MRHALLVAAVAAATTILAGSNLAQAKTASDRAQAPGQASTSGRATAHHVTLTASRNVTEGHRYTVTIRLTNPRQATRIQLLQQQTDVFGTKSWTPTKTIRVNGISTHRVHLSPIETGVQKTRARVHYTTRPVTEVDTASTTVWAWTPLTKFEPYYSTPGTSTYITYAINGTEYPPGWSTYITEPSWETRHTLGHHCKALSGTLGLVDNSADGSSATFTLTDGTNTLYTSPTLTPGMDKPIRVGFTRIYRLWIHATNTSPDSRGTYPAIGDPELLCTGV